MITVDAQKLAPALKLLGKVMPTRTANPALTTMRMDAADGRLRLVATDLELFGFADVEASVGRPLATCLPAAAVAHLVKAKSGQVQFFLESGRLVTVCGSIKRSYETISPDDFPSEPSMPEVAWRAETDYATFGRMEQLTSFSVSGESVMYALTGILLEPAKEALSMVSSDGKRLSLVTVPMNVSILPAWKGETIVPVRPLDILAGLPKGAPATQPVVLRAAEKEALFEVATGPYRFITRTIEGKFPDYQVVIPKDRDKLASFVIADVAEFLTQAGSARSTSPIVRLHLSPAHPCAVDYRSSDDQERVSADLPCEYSGEEMSVKFNPDFLSDLVKVLKAAGATDLRIRLRDAATAAVIDTPQLPSFTHVLMPLQATWSDESAAAEPTAQAA